MKILHLDKKVYVLHEKITDDFDELHRVQLEVFDDCVEAKSAVFNRYVKALSDIEGVHFMPELAETYSNRG